MKLNSKALKTRAFPVSRNGSEFQEGDYANQVATDLSCKERENRRSEWPLDVSLKCNEVVIACEATQTAFYTSF
ncbi:hypothetical protein CEXT_30091 [Caerostris extrusa]|uniref:Uncharacterized protein n=1 Tax=Caerostris extrusa TaxID=172846 RepID=A0AAV4VUA2_CAEEX|nr:hypothetical protein CEXT_30091 [Caerostris extrusa]